MNDDSICCGSPINSSFYITSPSSHLISTSHQSTTTVLFRILPHPLQKHDHLTSHRIHAHITIIQPPTARVSYPHFNPSRTLPTKRKTKPKIPDQAQPGQAQYSHLFSSRPLETGPGYNLLLTNACTKSLDLSCRIFEILRKIDNHDNHNTCVRACVEREDRCSSLKNE